ncbi:MAG TPA: LytTR family DNA-binding domain-containing protein [Bacteroidia bacterium]
MSEVIKAIIVDDEEKARQVLRNLLQQFCPSVDIIGETDNVNAAYEQIHSLKPDLVFLDVQMPNGNGFSLLERFKELFFEVIFVTGHDRYALNAIKFSALDYLLKPIEVAELVDAVGKATKKKRNHVEMSIQVNNLLNMTNHSAIEKRIVVHRNEKVILLKLSTIAYIEAEDRYCHITTDQSEKYTVTKTLKEFEELLAANDNFIRVNKNYMLNMNFIKEYTKGEPCFVSMENGTIVELSRRKKQEFLTRFKR